MLFLCTQIQTQMIKKLHILTLALAVSAVGSQAFAYATPNLGSVRTIEELLIEPEVSYNKEVIESPGWKGNWFIGVDAGVSSLLGTPKGCNDLWGRIKPHFGAYLGKWYTPTVGSRINFTGFKLLNSENQSQDYWGVSADFMWNLSNAIYGNGKETRFGVIPYVGVGMLHNNSAQTNPFAFSYGVMAQYGLTSRLKLTLEFGGKTTFSDFDGYGKPNSFGGDNLLSLSAGLSFTFGQKGFRRVINAKPIMIDNARLRETLASLYEYNQHLSRQTANDARALAELKKILEIEGLLSRYGSLFNSTSDNGDISAKRFPVNDYSGLNSLRARLKGYHLPNQKGENSDDWISSLEDDTTDFIDHLFADDANADSISELAKAFGKETAENLEDGESGSGNGTGCGDSNSDDSNVTQQKAKDAYLSLLSSGKKCLGSPILFFFKLGTSDLTDASQLVNLDEIARVAKTYGLHIRVTGAADSATGTSDINKGLGSDRANYISSQLQKRGISASLITKFNKGGIDLLDPDETNRHCKVELFLLP